MENRIAYQDIDRLAAEINVIKQQTARTLLVASIEIGERLSQAKNLVPHGEWEQWLSENVDYSQSTAQNLMKLYREYGGNQLGFSGKTPLEIFGSLTYTQALELLALPPDERETFVEENNVEDMSTRELQKAVAEAKAAKEEAEAERRRAEKAELELSESSARTIEAENRLKASRDVADGLRAKNDTLAAEVNAAQQQRDKEKEKADKAKKKAETEIAKLKAEIEELSKPRELTEEERAAVEAEISKKYEAQINQMSLTAEAAEANAQKIQEEKEALERKFQKESNADLQKFQALFERFQRDLVNLVDLADKIGGENAERLKEALKSVVVSTIGGREGA